MADTSYSDMKAADNRGTAVSEVQLRPDGSARIHGWLNQSRRLDYELGPVRPFSYTPDSLLKLSLPGSLGPRLSMAAVKQSITPKAKRRGAPAPPASEDASPGASGLAATLSAVADVLGGAASPFKADPPPRGGAASAASSSSSLVGPCEPLGRAASSLVGLCEPGEHGVGYRFVKAWLPEKDTFLLCHVDGFKHSLEEVSRERAARIYLRHYAGLAEDAVPLLPAAEAEGAEGAGLAARGWESLGEWRGAALNRHNSEGNVLNRSSEGCSSDQSLRSSSRLTHVSYHSIGDVGCSEMEEAAEFRDSLVYLIFSAMDSDANGRISMHELRRALQQTPEICKLLAGTGQPAPSPEQLLRAIDGDESADISRDELTEYLSTLDKIDCMSCYFKGDPRTCYFDGGETRREALAALRRTQTAPQLLRPRCAAATLRTIATAVPEEAESRRGGDRSEAAGGGEGGGGGDEGGGDGCCCPFWWGDIRGRGAGRASLADARPTAFEQTTAELEMRQQAGASAVSAPSLALLPGASASSPPVWRVPPSG